MGIKLVYWEKMANILRFLLFSVLLAFSKTNQVNRGQGFTLVKHVNKKLAGEKLSVINVTSISDCLQHCLRNCSCSSFDICESDMKCYLRPYRNEALQSKDGYSHFEIKPETNQQHCHTAKPCSSFINCCLTSNPCSSRGKCTPTQDINDRFTCKCQAKFTGKSCKKCAPGYAGLDCGTRVKSCGGYGNGSRVPQTYHILDHQDYAYKVFCDFEKDSKISWTLIESYSLENRQTFQKPFFKDFRQNVSNPPSWLNYRMGKDRMQSVQNASTKWRVTCNFDKKFTPIHRYFIQGSKSDVDILSFKSGDCGQCKSVDYVNIRGHSCSSCNVVLFQTTRYPLHINARAAKRRCDLTMTDPTDCVTKDEDSFGLCNCVHSGDGCSTEPTSTTNTWLGV